MARLSNASHERASAVAGALDQSYHVCVSTRRASDARPAADLRSRVERSRPMGRSPVDMPDPIEQDAAPTLPLREGGADDLLAQLADDVINRLLEDRPTPQLQLHAPAREEESPQA